MRILVTHLKKKGTPASPATALARSVFPVPGGPVRSTPLGSLPPRRVNLEGILQEGHNLLQLCLSLLAALHVCERLLALLRDILLHATTECLDHAAGQ